MNNKNKIIIWLDDIRDPFIYIKKLSEVFNIDEKSISIVWLKSYNEFTSFIKDYDLPYAISFDHDLGEDKSGYDCAKWLINYCMKNNKKLPKYISHSSNPVGKENILKLLNNFKDRYDK